MYTPKRGIESFGREPEAVPDFATMNEGQLRALEEGLVTVPDEVEELQYAGMDIDRDPYAM